MSADALIIVCAAVMCVNGWHRGLSRCLRGALALVAAVFAAPYVYMQLAAWIYSKVQIEVAPAVVLSYLLCLFVFSAIAAALLGQLLNSYWADPPWLVDRCGGFLYGACKAAVIVLLTTMVSIAPPPHFAEPLPGRMQMVQITAAPSQNFMQLVLPWAHCLFESKPAQKYLLAKPQGSYSLDF